MRARWLAIVAVAAQTVACQGGAGTTPSPAGSSTPVAQQSPSTAPGLGTNPSTTVQPAAIKCTSPIPTNHPLALVNLYGIEGAVVRDLADFDHPSTVCSLPACDNSAGCQTRSKTQYDNPLFAGPARLSYYAYDASGSALFVFDMRTGSLSTELASHAANSPITGMAWSPDGTRLTYELVPEPGLVEWHLVFLSLDTTMARFDNRPSGSAGSGMQVVGFSADGQYVAESDNVGTQSTWRTRIVRVADGSTAKELAGASEAVWGATGSRLYFQNDAGVQVWDAATHQLGSILPNYRWTGPRASADGKRIAFTMWTGGGVGVLDLATGNVLELISSPQYDPRFLTSDLIWSRYKNERYIFDLATGKEFPSIDYVFFDAFPRTLAQLST
jgi:WD40 repeat protein